MSDVSQGTGWWEASDGKWYPPETHPNYRSTPRPAPPKDMAPGAGVRGAWTRMGTGGQVVLIAVVILVLVGIGSSRDSDTEPRYVAPRQVMITYKVTGSATSADITFENSTGDTSQQSGVDVPLVRKSGAEGLDVFLSSGDFYYISAQNQGDSGTITCSVLADGVLVKTNTSEGEYVITTCSGRVP